MGRTVARVFYLANAAIESQFLGEFQEAEATLARMRLLLSQLAEPGRAADKFAVSEIQLLGYRGKWAETAQLARALQTELTQHRRILD